ncbi:hypothetical protein [Streptomyces griseofuscus]|uniref:hypothetical protein n=1 Tax=Streptomyces griseofuscus TaxID=146922 RepID=UPI003F51007D
MDFVAIEELLGHPYIGVVAGVYAHVRLRLRRQTRPGQAINTLGNPQLHRRRPARHSCRPLTLPSNGREAPPENKSSRASGLPEQVGRNSPPEPARTWLANFNYSVARLSRSASGI